MLPTLLDTIKDLCSDIEMSCLGNTSFHIRVEKDNKDPENGRIFLQIIYEAPCTKTNVVKEWHGRKFYLSDHMTTDEIVKTAFLAFKLAIEHEVMEGFRMYSKPIFNPHVHYEALIEASSREVSRENP